VELAAELCVCSHFGFLSHMKVRSSKMETASE